MRNAEITFKKCSMCVCCLVFVMCSQHFKKFWLGSFNPPDIQVEALFYMCFGTGGERSTWSSKVSHLRSAVLLFNDGGSFSFVLGWLPPPNEYVNRSSRSEKINRIPWLLNKHPINYCTSSQLLCKHPITTKAPNYSSSPRFINKSPITNQAPNY